MPWDPRAGGFAQTVWAYGNALGVAAAGTAAGLQGVQRLALLLGCGWRDYWLGRGWRRRSSRSNRRRRCRGSWRGIAGGITGFVGSIFAPDASTAAITEGSQGALLGYYPAQGRQSVWQAQALEVALQAV